MKAALCFLLWLALLLSPCLALISGQSAQPNFLERNFCNFLVGDICLLCEGGCNTTNLNSCNNYPGSDYDVMDWVSTKAYANCTMVDEECAASSRVISPHSSHSPSAH